jgi:hypothetical protein
MLDLSYITQTLKFSFVINRSYEQKFIAIRFLATLKNL